MSPPDDYFAPDYERLEREIGQLEQARELVQQTLGHHDIDAAIGKLIEDNQRYIAWLAGGHSTGLAEPPPAGWWPPEDDPIGIF